MTAELSILCIDPGKTTGFMELWVPPDKPAHPGTLGGEASSSPELFIGLFEDWAEWTYLNLLVHRVVIIETWEYRHNQPTDARMACEPIGMVKMLCAQQSIPIIEQKPGFRSSIPDTKKELKSLGYWIGLEGHARQATRHGLAYLVHTAKHRPTMEHIFPRPRD